MAIGTAFSGAASYVLLVMTARALGPARYGDFSYFWAVIVVVSLGLFLPIEQVVARRLSRLDAPGVGGRPILNRGVRTALVVAVVSSAVVSVFWVSQRGWSSSELLLLGALGLGVIGFVIQFPGRGALAASSNFRGYAAVVSVDAGLRLVIVMLLWGAGVRSAAPFAAAVGLSALTCGVLARVLGSRSLGRAPVVEDPVGLGREAGRLISAAVSMQLLLNSGVLIAVSVSTASESAFAGHLVAVLTIARVPVFVFQSVQASYLSKIALRSHRRDIAGLRRVLLALATAVGGITVLTIVGAAAVGPQVIRLIYGPSYEFSRVGVVLVALGVCVYLAAAVANDVAVAIGAHSHVRGAWFAGVAAAAVVVASVDDLLLRSTLPLVVGAAVAGAVLASPVIRSVRWKVEP
ncbi:lipopolysaccharide biosynthesis protein [Cellulomonas sp. P24]|uniref:lipopolysaccharide biosynthesis protein n=1 Tax=Cellulomonas sp. P24 TaxID=2885206 RepID=UPI00216ADCA9|nr:hypothetical protein [Cellulomonas sp. P24]MCR6491774.1 hypothetical protein [Cellulomonas sp. P24]